jgi:rubrerythrin
MGVPANGAKEEEPMATGIEQIRTEQPVKNTVHNLVQTLSTKLDSAARYGLYRDDARQDGMEDCAEVFANLAARDGESIEELLRCLRDHIDDA